MKMPNFKNLEEVADYLKSIGYKDVTVYRRSLIVKKNFSEATVCKVHSKWNVDVELDQSGYDFYAENLQEVVTIIIQKI